MFSLECPKWIILKQSNDFHGHSVQGLRKTRNSPKSTSVGNINLVANKKKLSNPFLIDCEICLETHICFCVFPWVGVFLPLTEAGAVCHFAVICYLQSYYFSSVGAFSPPPQNHPHLHPPPLLEKGRRNSKAWQGRSEWEGGDVRLHDTSRIKPWPKCTNRPNDS